MAKKSGLGRGLESLLGETAGEVSANSEDVQQLRLCDIVRNPDQPRKIFDPESLDELADSIRENGVLQPILVRKAAGCYQIVAGERRYQAAKKAGLDRIPAVVREVSDEDMFKLALIENVQRSDLNPIETARGYKQLMVEGHLTQEDLSKVVSKSRSSIANTLRLLDLSRGLQELIIEGKITQGHARALMTIPDEDSRMFLAERVVKEDLSVRQTENLAALISGRKKIKTSEPTFRPEYFKAAEKTLKSALSTNVKVRQVRGKNKIEIEFKNDEDLARLINRLSAGELGE